MSRHKQLGEEDRAGKSVSDGFFKESHAQSEVIGSILMASIVILSAVTFGTFLLDTVQDEADNAGPTTQVRAAVTTEQVTFSHNGGDPIDTDDLRVTVAVNGTETWADWSGNWTGDATFDPGETWRYSFGSALHPDAVVSVQLVDTTSNTLLFEDERNPRR